MSNNQTNALYSETTKHEFFKQNKEKSKNNKYILLKLCTHLSCENLKSFNPVLQLKNTESEIKSELKNCLNELRAFKFVKKH